MRLTIAVLTVATGAAGAVLWLPDLFRQDQLAVVTEIGADGLAKVAIPRPAVSGADGVPAETPFFGFALPTAPQASPTRTEPGPPAAPVAEPVVQRSEVQTSTRELSRPELARELQRELRRVGCYAGDIDGNWGPGSKRAAQTFMQRINAALPTDVPDMIQLTLVRGYAGDACAAACPPERMVPGTGRCVPAPVMAARPQTRPLDKGIAAAAVPAPLLVTGSTRPPARPSAVARSSQTAPATQAAPLADDAAARMATAPAPVTIVPLQGRMAVGGPPVPVAPIANGEPRSGVSIAAPPRASRETRRRPSYRSRADRSWTATFFDR